MTEPQTITVIVPERKGVTALAGIANVEAVLVEPDESIPETARDAKILVVGPAEQQSEVDAALKQIKQLPKLQLLQTLGQGTEQWDGVLPEGLKVSTARGAHGGSTAEWAVMALLALTRDLPLYLDNQREHTWNGRRARTLLNADILIYGASDLGQNVQTRLRPFGARVTLVGTHARGDIIDQSTAYERLPRANAVILALPLTADTEHIANKEFLARMQNGAILVNAGRGGLVDQPALVQELQAGRLQAALDVTTPEPLPATEPLWDAPGLILTPHVGGNTDGADDRAWQVATEQIKAYLRADKNNN